MPPLLHFIVPVEDFGGGVLGEEVLFDVLALEEEDVILALCAVLDEGDVAVPLEGCGGNEHWRLLLSAWGVPLLASI